MLLSAWPTQPEGRTQPTSSGSLRAIPGSYDLDAWPINVPLQREEQLVSWATRLADRYGVTPAVLLRTLLPRVSSYSRLRVGARLAQPNAVINTCTGINDRQRRAAWDTEQRLGHERVHLGRTSGLRMKLPVRRGSYFCPACLAEGSYWHQSWTDPAVFVCVHHAILLQSGCPRCGVEPFTTTTWASTLHASYECHAPAHEARTKRTRIVTCHTDLRNAPTSPASADLIAATNLLLAPDTDRDELAFGGRRVTIREARAALLLLAFGHLRTTGRDDPEHDDDSLFSGALEHAMWVLYSGDRARVAARAATSPGLRPGSTLAPLHMSPSMLTRRVNPLLHAVVLDAHGEFFSRPRQLSFRIGTPWPRLPVACRHRLTPHPANATDWETRPAPLEAIRARMGHDLLPAFRTLHDDEILAAAVAIALVGRPDTVNAITENLGSGRSEANTIPHVWDRLAEAHGWTALRTAMIQRADEISQLTHGARTKSDGL